jgi:hypothetical protein
MTQPNDPAFPTTTDPGMSKREWTATQIYAAMIARGGLGDAVEAVRKADHLIAVLNQIPTPYPK